MEMHGTLCTDRLCLLSLYRVEENQIGPQQTYFTGFVDIQLKITEITTADPASQHGKCLDSRYDEVPAESEVTHFLLRSMRTCPHSNTRTHPNTFAHASVGIKPQIQSLQTFKINIYKCEFYPTTKAEVQLQAACHTCYGFMFEFTQNKTVKLYNMIRHMYTLVVTEW